MRAFASTPDTTSSTRLLDDSQFRLEDDEDSLPTRFRPFARSQAKDCNPVSGERNGSMIPARRRASEASLSLETLDGLSSTHGLPTCKAQSRIRVTSTSAQNDADHDMGPTPFRFRASPIGPHSARLVLSAVEIANRKRSHMANAECPTDSTHLTSSHYPSPPASHISGCCVSSHSIADPGRRGNLDPALPLKASKYFAPAPTLLTRSMQGHISVVTLPGSPTPKYIESPNSEYVPLVPHKRENNPSGKPGYDSDWANNLGLFSDLMVMLKRLKPILIQESVRDDPWKVLIAARLLNVTTGKAAIPIFCKIISHWPTPQDLAHASQDRLIELLRPLGLYNKRANWLKDISEHFLEDQPSQGCLKTSLLSLLSEECAVSTLPPLIYPGVGPYALDSLRIFCAGDKDAWKHVMPRDKELVRYLRWRWAAEEEKMWYPETGITGDSNVPYLITLVDELAMHYDNAIGGEGYMYHFCNDLSEILTGKMTEPSTT